MRKIFICFLWLVSAVFLFSCRNNTENQFVKESTSEEYPVIIISDTLSGNSTAPLCTLKPDFIQRFLSVAEDYQGTRLTMRTPLPSEWGLVGIERLPQGRELWLLQSQNREWTYLAITSGSGTQRILDIVPIGIDLASDEGKTLEREVWSWQRNEEGAFVVEKNYEWKKSIADAKQANASDYVKKSFAIDKYIVGEMGRFECFPQTGNDTLPYKVAVFYCSSNVEAEEWDDKTEMMEAFCEDFNICYAKVQEHYDAVSVQDYTMNDIVTLDIRPQMDADSVGMILYQNGKEPKSVKWRSVEYLQMEIKKYFKQ